VAAAAGPADGGHYHAAAQSASCAGGAARGGGRGGSDRRKPIIGCVTARTLNPQLSSYQQTQVKALASEVIDAVGGDEEPRNCGSCFAFMRRARLFD